MSNDLLQLATMEHFGTINVERSITESSDSVTVRRQGDR